MYQLQSAFQVDSSLPDSETAAYQQIGKAKIATLSFIPELDE
jgi:hypothetical protein